MKAPKTINTIILVLASITCMAQNESPNKYLTPLTGGLFMPYYFQYEKTPFMNNDWSVGTIRLKNGDMLDSLKINYDSYKGNLLYLNDRLGRIVVIDNEIIRDFWIVQDPSLDILHGVAHPIKTTGIEPGFVFLLIADTISLYMEKTKKIDHYNLSYRTDNKLGKFYEETCYFFVMDNKKYNIPKTKRKLAKLFPAYKNDILSFIKSKRLSLKDPNQLILVFIEINRLVNNQ